MHDERTEQEVICRKYGVPFVEAPPGLMLGLSRNIRDGLLPINGLRHPPRDGATGWYIWAGEKLSNADDFFAPVHVAHLKEWCPAAVRFLGLPPGWRFLVAGEYEDVWEDLSLLDVR